MNLPVFSEPAISHTYSMMPLMLRLAERPAIN